MEISPIRNQRDNFVRLGWCLQREKIDWQEARKIDCQLVRTIFLFLLSLVNFHKTLVNGQKIKF